MTGRSMSDPDLVARLNAYVVPGTFAFVLGVRFVTATRDLVEAELRVAEDQISRPTVMHGGALMALADTVGGFATRINLEPGQGTTTIESKTNFIKAASPGELLCAAASALHKGTTTMVWQTIIRNRHGRPITVTTQTQLVTSAAAG